MKTIKKDKILNTVTKLKSYSKLRFIRNFSITILYDIQEPVQILKDFLTKRRQFSSKPSITQFTSVFLANVL